ncbi:tyrosine-type recombinase/integrase [Planctobacterium marinum]|uniref:tyrosine-type recombinase/integrase n=1 Tax=Planctobacterium marinum TaxID=1631968 RepID=UPI001E49113C|nr:tyrosine-type recombinase/integrase [Planctobacterium marinum]MCC2608096.1 tyrosine-type recombinase/integrase [Planctobacterium marinum]
MKTLNCVCSQFLKVCEKQKNLSAHTLKAYEIDLAQFKACIGSNALTIAIGKEQIKRFHIWLIELELSPTSIKRKLACVKAMFRWLELEEAIEANPFHKVKLEIKLPRLLPKNVEANNLIQMISTARRRCPLLRINDHALLQTKLTGLHKRELNDYTVLVALEVMLATGVRVGELSRLKIADISFPKQKIKILGKGSRERYVYIPDDELNQLLQTYIILRQELNPDTDNFLINSRSKPASTQFLRKLIKNIAEKAKISQKVTPHMLRHSAACELLDSGLDIRFVQRLLGHSSISTTEIYTHVSDNILQEKVTAANVRGKLSLK